MDKSRMIRTGAAVLLLVGYLGYREYRERQAPPAGDAAVATKADTSGDAAPPAQPLKFGTIAFTVCLETSRRSASSPCDQPKRSRNSRMRLSMARQRYRRATRILATP